MTIFLIILFNLVSFVCLLMGVTLMPDGKTTVLAWPALPGIMALVGINFLAFYHGRGKPRYFGHLSRGESYTKIGSMSVGKHGTKFAVLLEDSSGDDRMYSLDSDPPVKFHVVGNKYVPIE
jgi:hypothetical protein